MTILDGTSPEESQVVPLSQSGNDADKKVGQKEKYSAAIALMNSSETASVNRFAAFLAVSTILATGWVQLATRPVPGGFYVMLLICFLGFVAGIVWAGIGGRARSYVEIYRRIGERLEREGSNTSTRFDSPFIAARNFKPQNKKVKKGWLKHPRNWLLKLRNCMERRAGARKLFVRVPMVVSASFALLSVITYTYYRQGTIKTPEISNAIAPVQSQANQPSAPK